MLITSFDPFPLLYTERLRLREITIEDQDDLFIMRSDKVVMRFIDRPLAKSKEDAGRLIGVIQDSLKNNEGITWGISLQNEAALIGTIGFWKIAKEHHRAEIGYLLHPACQGKGLMQEAMTAVLDYGFKTMRLHSVEANVNPQNEASIKILERNQFEREAYFRENYYYNEQFLDSAIYSLLSPLDKS